MTISIKSDPTGGYLITISGVVVGRAETRREANALRERIRRSRLRAQGPRPIPIYTIYQYAYQLPDRGVYAQMGIGWGYRIRMTGEWENGFPTEGQAIVAAEAKLKRSQHD